MTRAWYWISSTGSKLVTIADPSDQDAIQTLEKDRFLDDLLGEKETKKQVHGTKNILGKGGFNLKFLVYSGAKPCDKASSNGEAIKMLGHKWMTEADLLSPGSGELNFKKKVRGMKKPKSSRFQRGCAEITQFNHVN